MNLHAIQRIVHAAERVYYGLHAVLTLIFLVLVAAMIAAWLGGGWLPVLAAMIAAVLLGVPLSKRLWLNEPPPPPPRPLPPEWRQPLVQDEFERVLTRQRVLGFLLVAAAVLLAVLRFAYAYGWPRVFGLPREQLLIAALCTIAVVLPLGLLNWRCPLCRSNLDAALSFRQCPRCGIVLRG